MHFGVRRFIAALDWREPKAAINRRTPKAANNEQLRGEFLMRITPWLVAIACTIVIWPVSNPHLAAGPINPAAFEKQYQDARKTAEVDVQVRCLAAVCTATEGEGKMKTVSLQLSMQVLKADKG